VSGVKGKVGGVELEWQSVPQGSSGEALCVQGGTKVSVSWRRDREGLWIETDRGVFGFDIVGETGDDGRVVYQLRRRVVGAGIGPSGQGEWRGLSFLRAGEESVAAAAGGQKRGVRIRAQMPGKIIRISVKIGDIVEKGQSLLVMEAMKMENEIRAAQSGKVTTLKVTEGQIVETGADLCLLDPV
jgi:acetyl/propionyl-CoA carboxylase alpha subunit